MKNLRQEKILELIKKHDISTQDALIAKLREAGFDATQTTVSRDIRQLKLVKGPTGHGTYKYVASDAPSAARAPGHTSSLGDAVLKIEAAQNILVVKTLAGMANAIAVCTENMHVDGLVGSVAGDDTLLMVFRDNSSAAFGEGELRRIFGH